MTHQILRRATAAVAGAAALTLGVASAASAHHCYKVDWNERAQSMLASNSTAWIPITTLGMDVMANEIGLPQCTGYVHIALEHWMDETGATTEPFIHSRATVGSGAAYQGKAPKGFAYLDEADFAILDEGLGMAVDQCYADMP